VRAHDGVDQLTDKLHDEKIERYARLIRGAIEGGCAYVVTKQLVTLWLAEGARLGRRSPPFGRPRQLGAVRRSKTGSTRTPAEAVLGALAAAALQWHGGLPWLRRVGSTRLALLVFLPPALYAASVIVTASAIVGVGRLSEIWRGVVADRAVGRSAQLASDEADSQPTASST